MSKKNIESTTEEFILAVEMPQKDGMDATVKYGTIIDAVKEAFVRNELEIVTTRYRATETGDIVSCVYKLTTKEGKDLLFTWTSAYNGLSKFQCSTGILDVTGTYCALGTKDYAVKRGAKESDFKTLINETVDGSISEVKEIVSQLNAMASLTISHRAQAEFLGVMNLISKDLSTNQYSAAGRLVKEDTTVLEFYRNISSSIADAHPKTWISQHKDVYAAVLVVAEEIEEAANLAVFLSTPAEDDVQTEKIKVDPSQLDLVDVIAEVEAEGEAEVEQETIIENEEDQGEDEGISQEHSLDDVVHGSDGDIDLSISEVSAADTVIEVDLSNDSAVEGANTMFLESEEAEEIEEAPLEIEEDYEDVEFATPLEEQVASEFVEPVSEEEIAISEPAPEEPEDEGMHMNAEPKLEPQEESQEEPEVELKVEAEKPSEESKELPSWEF